MRICALTVMAEIVTNVLHSSTEDTLTEERRKTRDSFLEHLLDHIMDVNVFVRSRVRTSEFFSSSLYQLDFNTFECLRC